MPRVKSGVAHHARKKKIMAAALADVGKIEFDARLEGRNMTMVIAPK